MHGFILIIAVPRREALLWVRRAWIGLELPLAHPDLLRPPVTSVLSGRTVLRRLAARLRHLLGGETMQGYLVSVVPAIKCLQNHAPEAADWWRSTLPDLIRPGRNLLFDRDCCQRSAANGSRSPWTKG